METVLLREFYADTPRRYILKPAGFNEDGWFLTSNPALQCRAYTSGHKGTERLDEVWASAEPRRWAYMREAYRESGWIEAGPHLWVPRHPTESTITLFEVIADADFGRRFAYSPDGRNEDGWVETGRKFHFLQP